MEQTDAWGRKIWNPEAEPFRVLATFRSSQPGCFGWAHGKPHMFSTEAEAREFAKTIKGAKSVAIHKAINGPTWRRNGRWQKI